MNWRIFIIGLAIVGLAAAQAENGRENCYAWYDDTDGCHRCYPSHYRYAVQVRTGYVKYYCGDCTGQINCTHCATNVTTGRTGPDWPAYEERCDRCITGFVANASMDAFGCQACATGCALCSSDNPSNGPCIGCIAGYQTPKGSKLCTPANDAFVVIIGSVFGALFVIIFCSICCYVRRKRKRQREDLERRYQEQVELNKQLQADAAKSSSNDLTVPAPINGNATKRYTSDAPTTVANTIYTPVAAGMDDRTLPTSRAGSLSSNPNAVTARHNTATMNNDATSRSAAGGAGREQSGTGRVGGTKGAEPATTMRTAPSSAATTTAQGLDTTMSTLQFKKQGTNQTFNFTIDASAVKLVPMDDLQMGAKLGSGGFGTVHRVTQRSTYTEMALKVFPEVSTEEEVEQFVREASVLLNLHHPHCLACLGIVIDGNELSILTEFMDGGDLSAALAKGTLTRADKIKALRDVAKGLAYLHGSGLTHADLKPSNVLLDGRGRAVLADFGLTGMTKALGYTERYAAPEVLLGRLPDTCSDVYSFGIVILTVLTGTPPFAFLPPREARFERDVYIIPGRLSDDYSQELREVVNASFAKEPTRRPHISAVTKALVECN